METLFMFAAGVLAGLTVSYLLWFVRTASGTLEIDQRNEEKDVYRLVVGDIESLSKKRRVVLRVDTKANLSQK